MTDETSLSKDVSSKLVEINRGLNSPNRGEQCRSIANIPDLIKSHPFPIVINSIFLRLADVYVNGACAECRNQLLRLTIADDIVEKFMPIYKNENANSRAQYLSLLGVLSGAFRDNISIHNFVISRIDSDSETEYTVAISTAYCYAAISKIFVISLCPVLCDLLKTNTLSPDHKLKLIPLAEFTYHNPILLPEIRGHLIEMLKSHRVGSFMTVICETLTKLEIHSPLNTSSQVDLLLGYIKASSDGEIRANLFSCLMNLADKLPNQWSPPHTKRLFEIFCDSGTTINEKETILIIFFLLTSSVNVNILFGDYKLGGGDGILACLTEALSYEIVPGSSLLPNALALACRLVQSGKSDVNFNPDIVASMLVVSLTRSCQFGEQPENSSTSWLINERGPPMDSLKLFYSELLMFFETFPNLVSLLNQIELLKEVTMSGDPRITLLCQFLSRVCTTDLLRFPELPELLSQLRDSCEPHSTNGNSDNLLQVCVFVFTAANGIPLLKEQQIDLLTCLARALDGNLNEKGPTALEPWIVYQLACKASVYRQPRFAADLFEQLASMAITLKNIYWLRGLAKINRAQADLYDSVFDLPQTGNWVPKLSAAISTAAKEFSSARNLFMAAGGRSAHAFQATYTAIRADLLNCLVCLCERAFELGALTSSGVPARWQLLRKMNAAKEENDASFNFTPLISLVSLMPKWKEMEGRVLALIQSCVDADSPTLRHLNGILEIIHVFIETLEECQTFKGSWENPSNIDRVHLLSTQSQEGFDAKAIALRDYSTNTSLSPQLLVNMVTLLVSLPPACLPTFFFFRKQVTNIDLYVISSANNKYRSGSDNSGDTFLLPLGTSLALQIIGVVSQKRPPKHPKLLRTVNAVSLFLSLQRKSKREALAKKLVPVRGDSFTAEFCLNLPTKTETCELTVEVVLVDDQRRRWRLGAEAGASKVITIKLENMAGSSNAGEPQKLIADFHSPLVAQVEDILMNPSPL
nr:integrator complex subunit 7 [Hymenolepis microstoma]